MSNSMSIRMTNNIFKKGNNMQRTNDDFSEWGCRDREKINYELGDDDIRRWYQRDIDQITHSTGFRKLQRKSQLLSEKDPRSRSRLIHTIEVSRIATEISEELGLSKELTEAICLAHDIGTSPYGYVGNSFLTEKVGETFSHEIVGSLIILWLSKKEITQSSIKNKVAVKISTASSSYPTIKLNSSRFDLNVSQSTFTDEKGRTQYKFYSHHIAPEILDGILNHGDKGKPNTLEGQVVRFADNIAYLSQDIEDIITTQIINPMDFTIISAETNELSYTRKINGSIENVSMSWEEIDYDKSLISLKDAFSASRGKRIATFIKRFVGYNKQQLKCKGLIEENSSILKMNIPQLQCDPGLQFVIDYIWSFIEKQYCQPIIATSNKIQKIKMEQLWTILHTDDFKNNNNCYKKFISEIGNNSLFQQDSDEWRVAYFISNLSWQEVDLILDSYHERNYTFDLDLDLDLGAENYANI